MRSNVASSGHAARNVTSAFQKTYAPRPQSPMKGTMDGWKGSKSLWLEPNGSGYANPNIHKTPAGRFASIRLTRPTTRLSVPMNPMNRRKPDYHGLHTDRQLAALL